MKFRKMISVFAAAALLAGGLVFPAKTVRADSIPINTNYFDAWLVDYLLNVADHNGNNILEADEMMEITEMEIGEEEVYSLDGIEYFDNLKLLSLNDIGGLVNLDLTGMCNLEQLYICSCYELEYVTFGDNDSLRTLYVTDNPNLTQINIIQAPLIDALVSEGDGTTNLIAHEEGVRTFRKNISGEEFEGAVYHLAVFSDSVQVNYSHSGSGEENGGGEENQGGQENQGGNSGNSGNSGSSNSGNSGNSGNSSNSGNSGNSGNSSNSSSSSNNASSESGVAGFVERLYTVALGRRSDPNGKQSWIDAINAGEITGADAARGFLYSSEFLNKDVSYEEFVVTLYRTFFDREPDQAGFNSWMDALYRGAPKEEVIEGFINSTEWANVCARFGIASGTYAQPTVEVVSSQGTLDFCSRLYSTCLGRTPDEAGLRAWARQLTLRNETGEDVALGFFFSDEFINQNVDKAEFITRLYRTFMGREPDTAGFRAWMTRLGDDTLTDRYEVFYGFSQSPEFSRICSSYGIQAYTYFEAQG